MRKETVMNITEREIDDPEKEGVILEYVNFTKEFAEIKEYVRSKGQCKTRCLLIRQISFMKLKADCISWKRK